jgi:YD repeat-containing protein
VIQEIDPTGGSRYFSYDTSGNLTRYADQDGRVTLYAYNSAGQATSETWYADAADANAGRNATNVIQYTYDSSGDLASESESDDGATDLYSYDANGNLISTTQQCPGAATVVLAYQYNASDERTSVSATINGVPDYLTTYQYDANGNMTQITQTGQSGGDAVTSTQVDLGYNAAGQFQTVDMFQSGHAVAQGVYQYDSLGRLTGLVYGSGSTILASYSWSYAANGSSGSLIPNPQSLIPSSWLPGQAPSVVPDPNAVDVSSLDQQLDPASLIAGMTSVDGTAQYSYDSQGEITGATYSPLPPGEG